MSLAEIAFVLWPTRRRNVRIVTSSQLRRRRNRFNSIFGSWFVNLLLLAAGHVAEHYLVKLYVKSRSLSHYLSQIPPLTVSDLSEQLHEIIAFMNGFDRVHADSNISQAFAVQNNTTTTASASAPSSTTLPVGVAQGSSDEQPAIAVPVPNIKRVLAVVVHLRGKLFVQSNDQLVVAPNSQRQCVRFRWSVTQHYLEKETVTKRRKIRSSRKRRKKTRSKSKRSGTDSSHSSSDSSSSESEYEEWEEDQTVERQSVVASGEGTSPGAFRLDSSATQLSPLNIEVREITRWGGEEVAYRATTPSQHGLQDVLLVRCRFFLFIVHFNKVVPLSCLFASDRLPLLFG